MAGGMGLKPKLSYVALYGSFQGSDAMSLAVLGC